MSKPFRIAAVVFAMVGLLGACQSIPSIASLAPTGSGPLATVTVRGGECPDGACGGTTVIERNGRVHQTAPVPTELGTLAPDALTVLDAAVNTTDFGAIRARPFTGECPVNVDGHEFIYEFGAPGGMERIATCETEIDPNHPLFVAVSAALAAAEGG